MSIKNIVRNRKNKVLKFKCGLCDCYYTREADVITHLKERHG